MYIYLFISESLITFFPGHPEPSVSRPYSVLGKLFF